MKQRYTRILRLHIVIVTVSLVAVSGCSPGDRGIFASIELEQPVESDRGIAEGATPGAIALSTDETRYFLAARTLHTRLVGESATDPPRWIPASLPSDVDEAKTTVVAIAVVDGYLYAVAQSDTDGVGRLFQVDIATEGTATGTGIEARYSFAADWQSITVAEGYEAADLFAMEDGSVLAVLEGTEAIEGTDDYALVDPAAATTVVKTLPKRPVAISTSAADETARFAAVTATGLYIGTSPSDAAEDPLTDPVFTAVDGTAIRGFTGVHVLRTDIYVVSSAGYLFERKADATWRRTRLTTAAGTTLSLNTIDAIPFGPTEYPLAVGTSGRGLYLIDPSAAVTGETYAALSASGGSAEDYHRTYIGSDLEYATIHEFAGFAFTGTVENLAPDTPVWFALTAGDGLWKSADLVVDKEGADITRSWFQE